MDLFTKVHEVYVKNFASVIHASKLKRGAHVSLVTFIHWPYSTFRNNIC